MQLRKKPEPALPTFALSDVSMLISPSDFPGQEAAAKILIREMQDAYRETARIASLTFCRGSVLMQEAQEVTADMIERALYK